MKNVFILGVILFSIIFSGCAAMFNGTSEQVFIRSNEKDAEIYVNGAFLGKDNAVASFQKKKNYTITVSKEGCSSAQVPVEKSFDAITLLGILLDYGLITILIEK